MIDKIIFAKLKQLPAPGGDVFHLIKKSDPEFFGFGEVYASSIDYGSIKAWKKHLRMTMNLVVISGLVKFVFYDALTKKYKSITIGDGNYARLTVPPGLWFGFKGLGVGIRNLIINLADIEHDPDEVERKAIGEINYSWNIE